MKYYSEKTVKKIMRKVKVEEIQDSPYDNLYTIQRKYPDLNKFDSIEIKEPHGRIVDLDKLIANFRKWANAPIRRTNKEIADFLEEYSKDSTILEANE